MAYKLAILALVAVSVGVASAADSSAAAAISSSTPTWTQLQQNWMGLSLLTQGSDKSQSGPLLSAMQSFGSGVQEGLTSLKTAVSSYNDTQSQAVLAAFNAEFCEEATYEAPSKKPLNFTGPSASLTFSWGNCTFNESQFLDSDSSKILNCTEPSIEYAKEPAIFTSKYQTGGTFTGKECVVEKDFGEETTQVLYVFDDASSLDILNITASLEKNIAGLMDGNSWLPSSSGIQEAIASLLPKPSST
ncbi:hypothetical protein ABBQ32_002899 [Trebouxia sp. C0010 RCD-2024]